MEIEDLDDNDPLKWYLRELATVQPLSTDQGAELLQQMRTHPERAEYAAKRLIEANLSLVVAVAEKYSSAMRPMLDLIQSGNESLLLALKSFSGDSSESFSAYAADIIDAALSKAAAESQS